MGSSAEFDREHLEDLLDLHDMGESVLWPRGMSADRVRKILINQQFVGGNKEKATHSSVSTTNPSTSSSQASSAQNSGITNDDRGELPLPVFVEAFRCPITQQCMREPVATPSGHSYEGEAIRRVVSERGFSPQTKRKLQTAELIPNRALAEAIEQVAVLMKKSSADSSPPELPTPPLLPEAPVVAVEEPGTPVRKRRKVLKSDISAPKDPPMRPPGSGRSVAKDASSSRPSSSSASARLRRVAA